MATTLQFGLVLAAIPYGFGRHSFYISAQDHQQASKLLYLSSLPSFWAVAFGKIAIALLLLRLKTGRLWYIFLWAMCAVQLATAIVATVMPLARCTLLSAAWLSKTELRDCWPARVINMAVYVRGAIAISSDLVFAAIPLTFLNSIRRSLRERLVVAFLLGLGVFTAMAVVVKVILAPKYWQTGDFLWDCVGIVTWSILEGEMGVIAGTVPCLKSPFEKILRRVGLLGGGDRSSSTPPYRLSAIHPRRKLFRHQALDSSSEQTPV